MDLRHFEIVLVRPARAANVAAACRAIKNMGLSALRLVEPPEGLSERAVRALAYGAWDVLDGARRAASLSEAVSESTLVAATTGRAVAGVVCPREFAARVAERSRGGRVSVVFGPEASGLTGEELSLCHELVHVPTDGAQPSLNLAQAVLLLSYELRLAALAAAPTAQPDDGDAAAARAGELERTVAEIRGALLEIGYLDAANPDRILTELRRLLARAAPTRREANLLRGLARQVSWAGRVARARSGNG
jgi:tRNA/rRNA methyltransferase/tRNA (cytidine32/uridine32-2'-O)-methyltransferase